MKKNLLILMTLLITIVGYSQTTFVNNFITYQITTTNTSNPTVKVTAYDIAGGTNVTIPSSVIYNSINNTVTGIGDSAFLNKGLTSVSIPNSVTFINYRAFQGNSLTNGVVIPNSVTLLGNLAFATSQLSSVVISNNLTTLPLAAFQGNNLTNIVIPNSVTTIGNNAFAINLLTNLIIPNSVTTIGNNAFLNNNQLSSVSLPEGLISIGNDAFLSCQLTSITIPSTVTSIGPRALSNTSLTNVFSLATIPPTITTTPGNGGTDTFAAIRSTIHLHIPSGTLGAYVTNAGALWTGFNPVTQDALGTSNFELENEIIIYNTTNELNVVSSNIAILENYSIYSISGAKVKNGTEKSIIIDDLSNGIYILELNFDKGRLVKKFVK